MGQLKEVAAEAQLEAANSMAATMPATGRTRGGAQWAGPASQRRLEGRVRRKRDGLMPVEGRAMVGREVDVRCWILQCKDYTGECKTSTRKKVSPRVQVCFLLCELFCATGWLCDVFHKTALLCSL